MARGRRRPEADPGNRDQDLPWPARGDVGGFEGGIAGSAFEIVEGSGSGELGHLRGTASVDATKKDVQTMTLDYDLA